MRLIDADALKEKLQPVFIEASCRDCPVVRGFVGLGNLINEAPTVTVPQWVSVKERLPSDDNKDWVLAVITEKNGYQWMPTRGEYRKGLGDWYFEETGWLRNHNGDFSVTHWMPLPEQPKEEEDG